MEARKSQLDLILTPDEQWLGCILLEIEFNAYCDALQRRNEARIQRKMLKARSDNKNAQ